jgi:hypothetical protein
MKRFLALFLILSGANLPALSVPVVPNFSAGSTSSRTESTQKTNEIIKTYSYSTGYTYTVGGTNIKSGADAISPGAQQVGTQTINGVSSSWTGITLQSKPVWQQHTAGAATNFQESYMGPGLTSVVDINRTVEIQSVTESTSVFTQ